MAIELIPVIEITNYENKIPMPTEGPYWEFSDDWESYHIQTNLEAGFSKDLKPYSKGSSFYRISEISDLDLLQLIQKTFIFENEDETLKKEDLNSPFNGGYILKLDGNNTYFPQCCSDLGDIEEWNNLLVENEFSFYMGHPSPRVIKTENSLIFDFLNSEIQENYAPPVFQHQIELDKIEFSHAVQNVKKELKTFSDRLVYLNQSEHLNIPNIENILIYGVS
ncbi:hypothetical protein ASG01_10030 [Chryseobacterium sp. Leaf180]|uniref:hypothetical protein n=1 Tax=Chryseobacterium sp. Leaf180 TaxID=1736289 RepID=UPI0006FA3052|nr:hypothetical protein [Chryseobacterium sp. Leaf180]KQR93503.1 hypothetical protein ASG01_10030 [Chryseobacterium sp. Leaf180]